MFIMKDPWWEYVLLRSAMNIQWTIVIELGFYIVFALTLLLPIRAAKAALASLSLVAFHAFAFPGGPTLSDLTGIRWGILTSRQGAARWFFFGVLLHAIHWVACTLRARRRDSASLKRASPLVATAATAFEAAASGVVVGALVARVVYWHREKGRFNKWGDSADVALVLAVHLGGLWLAPVAWMLRHRALQYLGKISYSVYLTHMAVKHFLNHMGVWRLGPLTQFAVFLGLTAVVSTVTFEVVEKPMNRLLRCKWAPSRMPAWAEEGERDTEVGWIKGMAQFVAV